MLLSQLFTAASAAAFLIIPETLDNDEEAFSALPFDAYTEDIPAYAMAQTLDVPCHDCEGDQTHITMELAVEDRTRLTMNGFELYPNADPWRGDLMASVVDGEQQQEQKLGYAMSVSPAGYDKAQGLEVIKVSLRIIEVGYQFVEGIPPIEISLVKARTNEILVGGVHIEEENRPACASRLCQVKQGLRKAWKGLKHGCGKHRGAHGHKGMSHAEFDGERPHHGHDGHHAHMHGWASLFMTIIINIMMPILLGIAFALGFVTIFYGCYNIIAALARCRRNSSEYSAVESRFTEPAAEEEKAGLMEETEVDEQEAPPQYESPKGHIRL